jgi:protein O-GlcNAc transferase
MAKIESIPPSPLAPPRAELDQLGILFNTGRYMELQSRAHQLLGQYPNSGMIWKLFGLSLQMQGKDALPALKKAAELLPRDAEAHGNLAAALRAAGQLEGAIESGRRALKINPDFAEAYNNLAVSLQDLGQLNEAIENYRRAIKIKPGFAEAHNNLGSALKDIGQLENGLASYRRALEIKPDFTDARSNFLQVLSYSSSHAASDVLEQARQYGRLIAKKVDVRFSAWQCKVPAERLKVGLVSGDLNNHPVGYFLESLLAQLDHSRIELIAYPTNPLTDELTTRIKPCFAAWNPLYSLSDAAAATLIHSDGVHVLLDLSGHTEYNRLPVFAWKPAPVQASWLGYWSTTGVAEMDYLLADKVSIPEARRGNFSESVWYLPDTRLCFTPPEIDLPVASLPALKNGHLTRLKEWPPRLRLFSTPNQGER